MSSASVSVRAKLRRWNLSRLTNPTAPAVLAVLVIGLAATALIAVLSDIPQAGADDEAAGTASTSTDQPDRADEPGTATDTGTGTADGAGATASPGELAASATTAPAAPATSETTVIGGASLITDDSLAGVTATTRLPVVNECPVMTDSIRRLYRGFLRREPTANELEQDIERYRSGDAGLATLASVLAGSNRFRTLYGPLSNAAYVERVYANTIERPPSQADTDFWTANLTNGYSRGDMMLAFTESEEFVRRTGTVRPLSGYLAWYPEGVHWYCGLGPIEGLPIRELTDSTVFADYLFTNRGGDDAPIGLTTFRDGRGMVQMMASTLPPGFSDFRWDGMFAGADHYGDALDVDAGDRTSWVVVLYPSGLGNQRLGWQVG